MSSAFCTAAKSCLHDKQHHQSPYIYTCFQTHVFSIILMGIALGSTSIHVSTPVFGLVSFVILRQCYVLISTSILNPDLCLFVQEGNPSCVTATEIHVNFKKKWLHKKCEQINRSKHPYFFILPITHFFWAVRYSYMNITTCITVN